MALQFFGTFHRDANAVQGLLPCPSNRFCFPFQPSWSRVCACVRRKVFQVVDSLPNHMWTFVADRIQGSASSHHKRRIRFQPVEETHVQKKNCSILKVASNELSECKPQVCLTRMQRSRGYVMPAAASDLADTVLHFCTQFHASFFALFLVIFPAFSERIPYI